MTALNGKNILLVISGGIAAYKALELIRLLKKMGGSVRAILTKGGAQFITPLSVASLTENEVYTDLFSLKDETEMGHIRLSREADLIVVAPASANTIAKIAYGMADDLAAATLLASDKGIMIAPAMNPMMWENAATQDNIATLKSRGFEIVGPAAGEMACGETGMGRMVEPENILSSIQSYFAKDKPLTGYKALITSGPTYEPLDPVRFIGNRSSGKQGHAIAAALQEAGADVTLISGPVNLPDPQGVKTIHVETAIDMHEACRKALPVDIAICAAAVSDWSAAAVQKNKIKKTGDRTPPDIKLKENPDILAAIAQSPKKRPRLVIGFAAETENLIEAAKDKRNSKGCDWIIANDVNPEKEVFGGDQNHVFLITDNETLEWPPASKAAVAEKIVQQIVKYFEKQNKTVTTIAAE